MRIYNLLTLVSMVLLTLCLILRYIELVRTSSFFRTSSEEAICVVDGVELLLFSGYVKGVVKEDTKVLRWFSDDEGVKIRRKNRRQNKVVNKKTAGKRSPPVLAMPVSISCISITVTD